MQYASERGMQVLGDRSTAGREILALDMGVRIPLSQPSEGRTVASTLDCQSGNAGSSPVSRSRIEVKMDRVELNADNREVLSRLSEKHKAGVAQVGERLLRTQEGGTSNVSTGSNLEKEKG